MPSYCVVWLVDQDADSPLEAAVEAFNAQKDPSSIATVFEVHDYKTGEAWHVDLGEENPGQQPAVVNRHDRDYAQILSVLVHTEIEVESEDQTKNDPGQSVPALRQAIDILARACEAGAYVGSRSAAVLQARVLVPKNRV